VLPVIAAVLLPFPVWVFARRFDHVPVQRPDFADAWRVPLVDLRWAEIQRP
jgi:hypothetical protein